MKWPLAVTLGMLLVPAELHGNQPLGKTTSSASRGTAFVPIELRGGLVLVRATLRGPSGTQITGPLIFDSGAPGLILSTGVPAALRLDARETRYNDTRAVWQPLDVDIGTTRLAGLRVTGVLRESQVDSGVVGLFGPAVLGERAIAVDYANERLAIASPGTALVKAAPTVTPRGVDVGKFVHERRSRDRFGSFVPAGAVAVPFRLAAGGRLLVTARVEEPSRHWGTPPLALLLDTGASACVLFDDTVAEQVGRLPGWPTLPGQRARTVHGQTRPDLALLPRLTLSGGSSPISADRVETGVQARASLPDFQGELPEGVDGVLGNSFLRRFHVVLDHANEVMWLTPVTDTPSQRSVQTQIGLELVAEGGLLKVARVVPRSPAAAADIRPGETVVSIGNVRIAGQGVAAAERLLQGAAGSEVVVIVRREGMERVLRLKRH